nr:gpi transamidase component gaa1 [Quercus suber]
MRDLQSGRIRTRLKPDQGRYQCAPVLQRADEQVCDIESGDDHQHSTGSQRQSVEVASRASSIWKGECREGHSLRDSSGGGRTDGNGGEPAERWVEMTERLLLLRRSPILLKLPPYLSALCVIIGIAWLFILPLDEYSRQTYISENAILPGQAFTYFGGSDHNIFRAYRHEVFALSQQTDEERIEGLSRMIRESGLKAAEQSYNYRVAGQEIKGTNVYGLLKGPRADATEAMVLIAAWRNFEGELNYSGVALALALMRYFKRWNIWSKDIFLLIPEDSTYGPEAWVSAYHSTYTAVTSTHNVSSLPIKAGALQAALALDYPVGPWGKRFEKLDIVYDGVNGALPNLDLLNTAIQVTRNQIGISCSLHGMTRHSDSYIDRLTTIAKGVVTQGAGHATGPHSAFMPYHVDAITLKTVGDGWHDEMSLGRTAESLMRSINNLLEHLHQSFFFYILLSPGRFVSIGNYLPAAMLIAGSFTITALALWMQSGRRDDQPVSTAEKVKVEVGGDVALLPKAEIAERHMLLPALVLLAVQISAVIPLSLLNHADHSPGFRSRHPRLAAELLPSSPGPDLRRKHRAQRSSRARLLRRLTSHDPVRAHDGVRAGSTGCSARNGARVACARRVDGVCRVGRLVAGVGDQWSGVVQRRGQVGSEQTSKPKLRRTQIKNARKLS